MISVTCTCADIPLIRIGRFSVSRAANPNQSCLFLGPGFIPVRDQSKAWDVLMTTFRRDLPNKLFPKASSTATNTHFCTLNVIYDDDPKGVQVWNPVSGNHHVINYTNIKNGLRHDGVMCLYTGHKRIDDFPLTLPFGCKCVHIFHMFSV
jgi:hypothetical protein